METIKLDKIEIGSGKMVVVAGPCVVESEKVCMETAGVMLEACEKLGLNYIFKASYDKANRTSVDSFRGPGPEEGLAIIKKVGESLGVPVMTDVHEPGQVEAAAAVADVLQIPAFLCRQTDLLAAAWASGRILNIKKGQFLSPWAMRNIVDKVQPGGGGKIMLTERGTTFGYEQLVVDMVSIPVMQGIGCPVIFDVTHSLQVPPGQLGGVSGGRGREFTAPLACAAMGAGADGVFLEVHPEPKQALSDPATSLDFSGARELIKQAAGVFETVRRSR
jgi:2-dehydro-3-deoxyphosphooctonate aldolase (KDO 8-P synthase)